MYFARLSSLACLLAPFTVATKAGNVDYQHVKQVAIIGKLKLGSHLTVQHTIHTIRSPNISIGATKFSIITYNGLT